MEPALPMNRVLRREVRLHLKTSSPAGSFSLSGCSTEDVQRPQGAEEGGAEWKPIAADGSWVSTETGRVRAGVSQSDLKRESAAGGDPVEGVTPR